MTAPRLPSPPTRQSIQILRAVAALAVAHTRYELAVKLNLGDATTELAFGGAGSTFSSSSPAS